MKNFNWMLLALLAALCSALPFFPHAHATNLITMSGSSQTMLASIQHLVNRQARAWENADVEAIVADFAEDARFVVPGTSFRGKQEIRAAAKDYFANFTNTQVTVKRIIGNDNEGAVEWSWSDQERKTGKKNSADDAIIFELENGKITYWREYIDSQSPEN